MIAKAIDKIITLSRPLTVDCNGSTYSTENLHRVDKELHADPIKVSTLTSLVQYVKEFNESWKEIPMLAHVMSPTKVALLTALDSDRERECLMCAEAGLPRIPFGTYISNEEMLITVQSMFVDDEETDKAIVLAFAGTVASGSVKEYGDDGVTQKATIKRGVASKAEGIVPSPCLLAPYRTFNEVEQPASKFIFRMREGRGDGVESALFEADGGAWKNEAMNYVRQYLEENLKGTGVVVIS